MRIQTFPFMKACALGNDFVMVPGSFLPPDQEFKTLSIRLADRRYGIGCDQVIYWYELDSPHSWHVRFFNADGSEAESCGNGTRCVAKFLMDKNNIDSLQLQTLGGVLQCHLLEPHQVSVDYPPPFYDCTVDIGFVKAQPVYVNVGNPHLVCFVEDNFDDKVWGPLLETRLHQSHSGYPERVNVGFATVVEGDILNLRVWERGAGFTPACGTGACAAAVAARARGFWKGDGMVRQQGGY